MSLREDSRLLVLASVDRGKWPAKEAHEHLLHTPAGWSAQAAPCYLSAFGSMPGESCPYGEMRNRILPGGQMQGEIVPLRPDTQSNPPWRTDAKRIVSLRPDSRLNLSWRADAGRIVPLRPDSRSNLPWRADAGRIVPLRRDTRSNLPWKAMCPGVSRFLDFPADTPSAGSELLEVRPGWCGQRLPDAKAYGFRLHSPREQPL
jgi:hypothetical protein